MDVSESDNCCLNELQNTSHNYADKYYAEDYEDWSYERDYGNYIVDGYDELSRRSSVCCESAGEAIDYYEYNEWDPEQQSSDY